MGLPEGVSPTAWVYADARPRTAAETRAVIEKRIVSWVIISDVLVIDRFLEGVMDFKRMSGRL